MDFLKAKKQANEFLSKIGVMFLATVDKNSAPSIRQMSTIFLNDKVYFQTSEKFDKTNDLISNPNCALGAGAYSFNGVAKIIGKPKDHPEIMQVFKSKHEDAYENYSFLDDEILVEVKIVKCKIWNGRDREYDGKETITTIDYANRQVSHVFCK